MVDGTPRATERSEGGSKRQHTSQAKAVLTERFIFRIDKATLGELEQFAAANQWSAGQAARVLLRRGMSCTPPPDDITRESFEESP